MSVLEEQLLEEKDSLSVIILNSEMYYNYLASIQQSTDSSESRIFICIRESKGLLPML